jgi:hypothetical protein
VVAVMVMVMAMVVVMVMVLVMATVMTTPAADALRFRPSPRRALPPLQPSCHASPPYYITHHRHVNTRPQNHRNQHHTTTKHHRSRHRHHLPPPSHPAASARTKTEPSAHTYTHKKSTTIRF